MENKPTINLRQYIPKKASKKFILQVIVYVIAFASVGILFYFRFNKKKIPQKIPIEIRGVTIEK